MSVKANDFTQFITQLFSNKKTMGIIAVIGIAGILLIGMSEWLPKSASDAKSGSNQEDFQKYVSELEKRTENMIISISGAGKCKVMITAQATSEQKYATDDSFIEDVQGEKQKSQTETQIVMIEGTNGKKQALIEKTLPPQICGVLVLCDGADSPSVSEKVTKAVKTVLGVSSSKICVEKLKE